jgi:catechol 2,3-dioxygenase-like lactoylglutathione lyase family enzyme
MKRTWPIIGVADVAASNLWYGSLLGMEHGPPHHDDFTMITDVDETVLVGLHQWGGHGEGPPLENPGVEPPGNGCLLVIRVDDFDDALGRARTLGLHFETDPEVFISGPATRAFTVRDPDGYYVTINEII